MTSAYHPTMLFHDEGGGVMNAVDPSVASTITLNSGKSHAEMIVFDKVYFIDQQGGKGMCGNADEVCGTICSDSHGTPHAVAFVAGVSYSESAR